MVPFTQSSAQDSDSSVDSIDMEFELMLSFRQAAAVIAWFGCLQFLPPDAFAHWLNEHFDGIMLYIQNRRHYVIARMIIQKGQFPGMTTEDILSYVEDAHPFEQLSYQMNRRLGVRNYLLALFSSSNNNN